MCRLWLLITTRQQPHWQVAPEPLREPQAVIRHSLMSDGVMEAAAAPSACNYCHTHKLATLTVTHPLACIKQINGTASCSQPCHVAAITTRLFSQPEACIS